MMLARSQKHAEIEEINYDNIIGNYAKKLLEIGIYELPIFNYQAEIKGLDDQVLSGEDLDDTVKKTKLEYDFLSKMTYIRAIGFLEAFSTHNETITKASVDECKKVFSSLCETVEENLGKMARELAVLNYSQPQDISARILSLEVEFLLVRDAFFAITPDIKGFKPKHLENLENGNGSTNTKVFAAISDYAELISEDPLATETQYQLYKAAHDESRGNWKRAEDMYTKLRDQTEPLIDPVIWARANYGALRCYMQRTFEPRAAALSSVIGFIDVNDMRLAGSNLYSTQGIKAKKIFPSFRSSIRNQINSLYKTLTDSEENLVDMRYDAFRHANQDYDPLIYQRLLEADAIIIFLSPDYFESQWCVQELTMALQQNRFRSVPLKWVYVETANKNVLDLREFLKARLVFEAPKSLNDGERAFVGERLDRLLEYGSHLVDYVMSPDQLGSKEFAQEILKL